jgi:hypothetical protein
MTRTLLRVAGVLVLAALLVGPSAQARAPHAPDQHARPAYGHTTNEFLMMGRNCGASMASG